MLAPHRTRPPFTLKELIIMLIHRLRTAACLMTLFILLSFTSDPATSAAPRGGSQRFVLVIDAGHGGKDNGASGKISKEKNINLNIALAFGRMVEANCPDVKVVYTRKTDVFVTLQGRADIANRHKANLFISIHTNSMPPGVTAPSGTETYTVGMHSGTENLAVAKRENSVITQEANYRAVYKNFDPNKSESYIIFEFMQDRNMKQSVELARHIQTAYGNQGRKNKGVHQAGFLVLRATGMPSVLTEVGFISNPEEERFLNSKEGIQKLARALYKGFCAYRNRHYADAEPVLPGDDLSASGRALAAAEGATSAREADRALAVDAMGAPAPAVVGVVPVATRAFRGGKRPVMNPAAPQRAVAAVVPAPPPTKVVEKRQALTVEQTALANVPPSPPPTPARPIVTSEDRTIPLLADAVLPDAGAKHAVSSAPSGRFERGTDAGLRRVDTVALQATAARGTEITVVQRDGAPTQSKTVEKPLTIVVIPSAVDQRVAAEALLATNTPPRQAVNAVDELPASLPHTEQVHSASKPHTVPKHVPDTYTAPLKGAKKTTVERPLPAAQPVTPAKTKAPEAKKTTEKGDREKKTEPKEAKSEKKDAKAVAPTAKPTPKEAATPAKSAKPEEKNAQNAKGGKKETGAAPRITFKVQILTSDKKLAAGDARLKGLAPVSFYHIGPLYRYTYGSSHDYAEIKKTLKKVNALFPNAFIVAFEGDQRVEDLQAAIRKSQTQ